MTNRYAPPKAPVEGPPQQLAYSQESKRQKSALRPHGVVLVVALFLVFSAVDAALLVVEGSSWWVVHVAITGLLVYWFRNLWWGDERERKIAVFLGFFCAALFLLGGPEGPLQSWSARELTELVEGCYFFVAASYLVYARRSPFFVSHPAL